MGANAQTSVFTFTAGQVLTAAQLNATARTGVPVFATTTDRDAAFGGTGEKTLAEGQTCYIEAAPKRLQVYNGTAWIDFDAEYQSFTPTFTNFTLGNGTISASYVRLGKQIHYKGTVTLGSTSSMGTSPTFTLPVTSFAYTGNPNMGVGFFEDATPSTFYSAAFYYMTTTTVQFAVQNVATFVKADYIDFARPMTWAVNDRFTWNIVYRAA